MPVITLALVAEGLRNIGEVGLEDSLEAGRGRKVLECGHLHGEEPVSYIHCVYPMWPSEDDCWDKGSGMRRWRSGRSAKKSSTAVGTRPEWGRDGYRAHRHDRPADRLVGHWYHSRLLLYFELLDNLQIRVLLVEDMGLCMHLSFELLAYGLALRRQIVVNVLGSRELETNIVQLELDNVVADDRQCTSAVCNDDGSGLSILRSVSAGRIGCKDATCTALNKTGVKRWMVDTSSAALLVASRLMLKGLVAEGTLGGDMWQSSTLDDAGAVTSLRDEEALAVAVAKDNEGEGGVASVEMMPTSGVRAELQCKPQIVLLASSSVCVRVEKVEGGNWGGDAGVRGPWIMATDLRENLELSGGRGRCACEAGCGRERKGIFGGHGSMPQQSSREEACIVALTLRHF
ncbi:hypothetical protein B0H17DRAFT_1146698 [Mycena rosella]|uniref:Uncharacterized protein n=1 Tax=Mycena rosella TaxID=1033263 RepID=A0AAD7CNI4_MYCRO|nr:hypothetical protein B0H17DRAFT_1146698 [Mycena rosella]